VAGTSVQRARARGVLSLLGVGALLVVVTALPASAEPNYPPSFYRISADSYTTHKGGRIGFTAQTFAPGSAVTFKVTVDGAAVATTSTTATGAGLASRALTFNTEGANTVSVSGTSDENAPLQMSTNVTVSAVSPGGSGSNTGGSNTSGNGSNTGGSNSGGSANTGGSGSNTNSSNTGNGGSGSNANNGGTDSGAQASGPQRDSAPFFAGAPPRSGSDIAITVVGALALIGAGGALVMVGRRRRTSHSD
jgi:hypothetical protein